MQLDVVLLELRALRAEVAGLALLALGPEYVSPKRLAEAVAYWAAVKEAESAAEATGACAPAPASGVAP